MKKPITFLSLIVLMALTAAGCEDEVESLSTDSSAVDRVRAGDLTFTLQILNMQGEPQSEFNEGENFQFQFVIENKGDSAYTLPVLWAFPSDNKEFFRLYRKTKESGGKADLGKSFKLGGNFLDAHPAWIPAQGASVYTVPWLTERDTAYVMPKYLDPRGILGDAILDRRYVAVEDSPAPLQIGTYFTGFTVSYTENDSVRLETSFKIE